MTVATNGNYLNPTNASLPVYLNAYATGGVLASNYALYVNRGQTYFAGGVGIGMDHPGAGGLKVVAPFYGGADGSSGITLSAPDGTSIGLERAGDYGIPPMVTTPFSATNHWTRFRISDVGHRHDFMIEPYQYGMCFSYPSVAEWWVEEFSVHNRNNGQPAIAWVGDNTDGGGVRMTGVDNESDFYAELSSEQFPGTSHGDLRLRVVGTNDSIMFFQGPRNPLTQTPLFSIQGNGGLSIGGIAGLSVTNKPVMQDGTTNLQIWSGGILVSNITNYHDP